MIPKGTTLYPQWANGMEMYFDDEPYAYWVEEPAYNFCNWVLYKEYDDYASVCNPNDCLSAVSYKQLMNEFRTYSFYEGLDREMLCRTFRQRSIEDNPYEFEDFVEE